MQRQSKKKKNTNNYQGEDTDLWLTQSSSFTLALAKLEAAIIITFIITLYQMTMEKRVTCRRCRQ